MSSQTSSKRPTAKRSPSILVTDVRNQPPKGRSAPFAGHNYKMNKLKHDNTRTKFSEISVSNLLSNTSDIPSAQRRLPPKGFHNRGTSPPSNTLRFNEQMVNSSKRNIRNIPKLTQYLPPRTSKTSQKLVLIPDHENQTIYNDTLLIDNDSESLEPHSQRSRAELMPKEARAQEFSRVTAYFICETIDLGDVSEFLTANHGVTPRLYDEVLYVPYALPLLPGDEGYRVRSNDTAKSLPSKKLMENMINRSEQIDHLYEYYSGVETPGDAKNIVMHPDENFENTAPFDPSEPQFFAPPDVSPMSTTKIPDLSKYGEMFVYNYGIIVFWNFTEVHEKNILADLAFSNEQLLIDTFHESDIETEEFHFEYNQEISRPRIYNDMITLRSGDHLIKLTMSHALAQSTKLCLFESRMVNILSSISRLPKRLALTGRLGMKREHLLKKSGKLFKLRVDVNLSSSILDTPNFFWSSEPSLHPLYTAVREYLEIEQRVQVLNDRCKVFLEFSDVVQDSINEKNTNRITWMIILIIFMSLVVSIFELLLEIA